MRGNLFSILGVRVVTEGCPVGAALAEQVLERSERDLRSGAEPDAVGYPIYWAHVCCMVVNEEWGAQIERM